MILGKETISTFTPSNVCIWLILAFQGGILNMGGLLACHSFVSHVTGFATLFGAELNRGHVRASLGMLLVPFSFMVGAMLSGYLVDIRLKMRRKPKYYIVFGILFALLLFVVVGGFNGLFGNFGEALETRGDYTLLVVLCLICGIQNGAVTLVSRSVVRTTHLTGLTTDLGIGLMRVLYRRRLGPQVSHEMQANWMRMGIIACFVGGSAFGYGLFSRYAYRGFLFPMAISGGLFFTMVYFQLWRPSTR